MSQVVSTADTAAPPYDVVVLDQATADTLAANEFESFASAFGEGGGAPDIRIGIGDTVVVTIFEAASGGLFSGEAGTLGAASKSVSLPPQPVARNGMITVPFIGQVKAAGLTPAQVQANIEAGLSAKAIEPQVIVTVTENASTFVTVAGDVGAPGRVPLGLDGDRILDVIATAGGSTAPPYDTFVRLTRGSTPITVSLARIVDDPGQNIYIRPEDQIYLIIDPQIFTAFGATARNATFPFETGRLTLAEAVGRAGGLLDSRANAHGVFVFRYERPELYALIRSGRPAPGMQAAGVPVVYRLDLKEPTGYFTSQRFLMRDNDVIYVSNAPATDLQKFLGIIGSGLGIARSTQTVVEATTN
jgi:polysaccharide export outer membrane protein